MFSISFRGQGFIETGNQLYNRTNIDTQFQKTCICNYNNNYKVTWVPYKTNKETYANLSQKQKYASFVRRTQDSTISKYENIQFQFRNL
jgi:hypothetical protein